MKRICLQRGFTIVEMLIAISVTVLLMTLIFQLFTSTRRAVSTGIKSGEMMVESEAIGDQLRRDAAAMREPDDESDANAGFLVIVQRNIEDVPFRQPGREGISGNVRSDQLIFIRSPAANRSSMHALTPESDDTLGSSVTASSARIWMGHVLRTATDGAASGGALGGGPDANPNRYANDWVLGRQALLLTDEPGDIFAVDATWGSAVSGASSAPIGSPQLFHGLTDVADRELRDDSDDGVLDEIDDAADYIEAVLPFAVPQNDERPWVNADPRDSYFEPWRVAQMHMHLSGNVSDFIVEFAGDYSPIDGEIDKDSDGNIRWYTHGDFANDAGATDPMAPTTWDAGTAGFLPADSTTTENEAYYLADANIPAEYQNIADAIFVFRHDDASDDSKWPYLIRIRYRLHDPRGRIGSHRFSTPEPGNIADADVEDDPTPGRWFEHVIRVNRP